MSIDKEKIGKLKKIIDIEHNPNNAILKLYEKVDNLNNDIKTLLDDIKVENNELYDNLDSIKTSLEGKIDDLSEEIKKVDITPGEKGERGEKGDKGDTGYTPIKGKDYFDGKDGKSIDEDEVISKILDKIPEPKNGIDADEKKIITEVLNKITIPDNTSKIEELEKEIEELKKIRVRGGGTSSMGVAQAFKWILKTEQPTGLINGSNTEYTVKNTIFAVLSFSLNGETIAQLPNYTISKNKIIFSVALPAAYSGKDFEIKYI